MRRHKRPGAYDARYLQEVPEGDHAEFGAIKVTHITTAMVLDFHDKITRAEKERGNTGDKAERLVTILGAILPEAMEHNLVAQNVVHQMGKRTTAGTDTSISSKSASIFPRWMKSVA